MKQLVILASLLLGSVAQSAIKTEVIEYKQGGTVLEGFLAYDDELVKGKAPAIILVHEWNGLGDYVKGRAQDFAAKGYVVFAADIYGKGVRPATVEESAKTSTIYKTDVKLMRARAQAAFDLVRKHKLVDSKKIVAAGYCFGGTTALEMGRAGLPLAGVVSFHGGLSTPKPEDAKKIKAKVLVLHGAVDPYVKPEEVAGFQKAMDEAKVDYQLVSYANTVHSFTNPQAGSDASKGAAYNALADKRSLQAFLAFMGEIASQ